MLRYHDLSVRFIYLQSWFFVLFCLKGPLLALSPGRLPQSCRLVLRFSLGLKKTKALPPHLISSHPVFLPFREEPRLRPCVVLRGEDKEWYSQIPPSFLLPVSAGHPTPCLRRVLENDQLPAFLMQSCSGFNFTLHSTGRINSGVQKVQLKNHRSMSIHLYL